MYVYDAEKPNAKQNANARFSKSMRKRLFIIDDDDIEAHHRKRPVSRLSSSSSSYIRSVCGDRDSIIMLLLLLTIAFGSVARAEGMVQVLGPNVSSCHLPTNLPPTASQKPFFNCCAPLPPYTPPLFRPQDVKVKVKVKVKGQQDQDVDLVKVRRPAHLADAKYGERLALAYSLMKALPDHDPRSFTQQANIHCAYCNAAYQQLNSTQRFQVHASWLFFPFHRWYLYFHERILAKLLADHDHDHDHGHDDLDLDHDHDLDLDHFALPFWNYDHPDGASMPWMYAHLAPLNEAHRDPDHSPPSFAAIDYLTYNAEPRTHSAQARENNAYLYRAMIRDSDSKYSFHGKPYRHGDSPMPGYGSAEKYPHNTLHLWIGSKPDSSMGGLDMGFFYASARDPLFYPHHAAMDRLWEVWSRLPGNAHLRDEDYLNTEFAFYNEHAEMVRVKVRDALDTTDLGYVYEDVPMPWVEAVPVRLSHGAAKIGAKHKVCKMGKPIRKPCSAVLHRDHRKLGSSSSSSSKENEEEEENLYIGGVQFTENQSFILDVFLNLPSATADTTTGCHEFVGTAFNVPQFAPNVSVSDFVLPLTRRIQDLELESESSVVVTFVPKGLVTGCVVSITTLSLQYPNVTTSSSRTH